MRRMLVILMILLAAALTYIPALGDSDATGIGMVEISVPQFAAGPVTLNLMITDMQAGTEPDILYFPFYAEKGLYASGEGEPAGARAEVMRQEQENIYTVSLKEPGKYSIAGIPFYIISAENEQLAALADEIRDVVDKSEGKTQKDTAQKLYEWLLKRVKSVIPEDRPDLQDACTDPFNCLLTGYALPETYGELYRLLLRSARIYSIPVSGLTGEAEHNWVMCRLDDQWVYADPAMDDIDDRAWKKYFAPEESQFMKDHVLSEVSERFLKERIRACILDVCLADDRITLDKLRLRSEKEGSSTTLFLTEGKHYSLGPSEPVTIRSYTNSNDLTWTATSWMTPEEEVRGSILTMYFPWDSEYQRFFRTDGTFETVPEDALEVLDHAADYSWVTVRFLRPGMYMLNGTDDAFYILDPENEDHAAVAARLDEALKSCRRETEKETARALHDWEKAQLKYDQATFRKMQNDVYDESMDSAQDPINALITGKSVCGGYARLYQLLLESSGIPCRFVSGFKSSTAYISHAWNVNKLDGEWSCTDVTWDEDSGSRYFAQPYDKFSRDHILLSNRQYWMGYWVLPKVYDQLLFRFYRDWGPKNTIPEALKVLPATVEAYGFPSSMPGFYQIRLSWEDRKCSLQNPGKTVGDCQFLAMNEQGTKLEGIGYYGVLKNYPHTSGKITEMAHIFRVTLQDYREGAMPADKASIRQILEMPVGGEIEYSEYNYQIPMKKNEIKGYGTGSYRIFTYDMNLKRISSSWHLVSETQILDVTAFFDTDGNTIRYAVSSAPVGGNAITWEATADGTITRLSYEYGDNKIYTLSDLTDKYAQERYAGFRQKLWSRYESFISEEKPPEEGVHLYALSRNEEEMYSGYVATATRDPLFRWNAQGSLEYNPDALDLNGVPINYVEFDPDLSVCERLQIAGN